MKIAQYFMIIVMLLFVFFFVSCTICCDMPKEIILTIYTIYLFVLTIYWIISIIHVYKHSQMNTFSKIILFCSLLFWIVPLLLHQGYFYKTGIIILMLNIIVWLLYIIKSNDMIIKILLFGIIEALLVFPYCSILWD